MFLFLFAEENVTFVDKNISEQQEKIVFNEEENVTSADKNITQITTLDKLVVEEIQDIDTYNDEIDIAVLLNKNRKNLFNFIPPLLNSINAYLIKKDIDYHIKLFNIEENISKTLDTIADSYPYIFVFITDPKKVKFLTKYSNYFFIPTLNKNQVDNNITDNIFFGGIDYTKQVRRLNQYIDDFTIIIQDDTTLSQYITSVVSKELLQPHKTKKYPIRKYKVAEFNNTFIYLNVNVIKTSEILQNFKPQIEPKSLFTTQIGFNPFLFSLTNQDDVDNLILANSIFGIDPIIEDNNLNLGTDITFNWLNFTTSTLLNKAYNLEIGMDEFFLNDFNLYIFHNQVQYKTNLYRINRNGFIKIVE
jgi:hypothetical protein